MADFVQINDHTWVNPDKVEMVRQHHDAASIQIHFTDGKFVRINDQNIFSVIRKLSVTPKVEVTEGDDS